MRILIVVGTRPNIIKLALLYKVMMKEFECVIVHTGQHYDKDMSDNFFDELELPEPNYNLEVGSGSHAQQTAKAMLSLNPILVEEKPDLVVVFGDTNASLSGALTAKKLKIPLAHIEAGVRCGDMTQPEELNRVIIDKIADLNFCPTRTAQDNLKAEAITGVFTGDIMLDSFLHYSNPVARDKNYVLVTIHREINTDSRERLITIFFALSSIKKSVEFPIHPRTLKMIKEFGIINAKWFDQFQIIKPVSYLAMLTKIRKASLVITDSGGVQKEAYWAGTPCITLDNQTGWVETLKGGCNILVKDLTIDHIKFEVMNQYSPFTPDYSLFGDGKAVERTVQYLREWRDCR
jgi:UDP-N-acetylglucosamine 2-epimerase